jgi:hypothetical protein
LPVIVTIPVVELLTPKAPLPAPPVMLPVIVTVPVLAFWTPTEEVPAPADTLPVMARLPVEVFTTACAEETVPPVQVPTIVAVAGDAAVNCRQFRVTVVDLLVTFAVSVTPLFSVKMPVPSLDNSVQVTFAVIVIVCVVDALASSAAPGTIPPTQVPPALKFPVANERMSAID